jgi:UDP-glucose 4-epimerase
MNASLPKKQNEGERILVTGATGFIGRRLVSALQSTAQVAALVRTAPTDPVPGVEYLLQDLAEPFALQDREFDRIVHCAHADKGEARELFAVNVRGTFDLLEYAKRCRVQQFMFTSTGNVYGFGARPFTENDPLAPVGLYAATKAAAEELVRGYAGEMDTVILRLGAPYGAGQAASRLIPTLLRKVSEGEPVVLQNADGNPRITPTQVRDVIEAIQRSFLLSGSHVLNVAGTTHYSIRELTETIGRVCGHAPRYEHTISPIGDIMLDTQRMHDVLGFTPRVPLAEGLAEMHPPVS